MAPSTFKEFSSRDSVSDTGVIKQAPMVSGSAAFTPASKKNHGFETRLPRQSQIMLFLSDSLFRIYKCYWPNLTQLASQTYEANIWAKCDLVSYSLLKKMESSRRIWVSSNYLFRITRLLEFVSMIFLTVGFTVCEADVDGVGPSCWEMSDHSALNSVLFSSFFKSFARLSSHVPNPSRTLFSCSAF